MRTVITTSTGQVLADRDDLPWLGGLTGVKVPDGVLPAGAHLTGFPAPGVTLDLSGPEPVQRVSVTLFAPRPPFDGTGVEAATSRGTVELS